MKQIIIILAIFLLFFNFHNCKGENQPSNSTKTENQESSIPSAHIINQLHEKLKLKPGFEKITLENLNDPSKWKKEGDAHHFTNIQSGDNHEIEHHLVYHPKNGVQFSQSSRMKIPQNYQTSLEKDELNNLFNKMQKNYATNQDLLQDARKNRFQQEEADFEEKRAQAISPQKNQLEDQNEQNFVSKKTQGTPQFGQQINQKIIEDEKKNDKIINKVIENMKQENNLDNWDKEFAKLPEFQTHGKSKFHQEAQEKNIIPLNENNQQLEKIIDETEKILTDRYMSDPNEKDKLRKKLILEYTQVCELNSVIWQKKFRYSILYPKLIKLNQQILQTLVKIRQFDMPILFQFDLILNQMHQFIHSSKIQKRDINGDISYYYLFSKDRHEDLRIVLETTSKIIKDYCSNSQNKLDYCKEDIADILYSFKTNLGLIKPSQQKDSDGQSQVEELIDKLQYLEINKMFSDNINQINVSEKPEEIQTLKLKEESQIFALFQEIENIRKNNFATGKNAKFATLYNNFIKAANELFGDNFSSSWKRNPETLNYHYEPEDFYQMLDAKKALENFLATSNDIKANEMLNILKHQTFEKDFDYEDTEIVEKIYEKEEVVEKGIIQEIMNINHEKVKKDENEVNYLELIKNPEKKMNIFAKGTQPKKIVRKIVILEILGCEECMNYGYLDFIKQYRNVQFQINYFFIS